MSPPPSTPAQEDNQVQDSKGTHSKPTKWAIPSSPNGTRSGPQTWMQQARSLQRRTEDITNAVSNSIYSTFVPKVQRKVEQTGKKWHNSRCDESGGYKPLHCGRLIETSGSDGADSNEAFSWTSESAMKQVQECGKPVCMIKSDTCTNGNRCASLFCKEHMCGGCQTNGKEYDPAYTEGDDDFEAC
ncbi:uncharacterized protein I206_107805 [Kwoniella pini CBS 10737]|uniref:Uncharacterized protein n=1 Tax=Kwoniella pini CBS 10737 TaxID=1296096 RepID=A0A1B9HYD1_9TREE|nr:uncharacterized protein I206_06138 [Kwoniella pini CBS 10737]OCF48270.1 hypothetical protein I206_06138 [Kwoniella pini CBS 10737]